MALKPTKRKTSAAKSKPADTHISEPALKFIDKAAGLLKQAIIRGEEETAGGRKAVRKKALSFLDLANERLTRAIKDGTELAKKGVRKI
ncbi:MAG: hypothetical protein LBD30_02730 [Verrucomicrobiales bacterium]|nr:hypothetical protein [Verrucomicrobiales bacterium]